MSSNIKVINFNKNQNKNKNKNQNQNQNNSNPLNNELNSESNNLGEIIFNSNDELNNNFFENTKEIIIEENIALENKELVYKDDTIYIQELENELLSTYPVLKQSDKFVIEKVEEKAKKFIFLKNQAINKQQLQKKNIDYIKKYELLNNDFSDSWIIPIVYDTHNVFTNIVNKDSKNNNENNINETILTQLKENTTNSNELEQKELLENLNNNNLKFEEGKTDILNYEEKNSQLYNSFDIKYDKSSMNNKGYVIHPDKSFNVLRYTDFQNNNWNTHKIINDYYTPKNKYDDDGKIIGIEQELLIRSDDQNIYGFLVLKEGNKNILKDYNDIYTPFNYSDHLHKVLYNKKEITKIKQKEKNIIQLEINEHNLNDDSVIYLQNTNCFPFIDGYYESPTQIKIIDKNNIEIKKNKNLIVEGDTGFMYLLSNLKYDYYDINDDLSFNYMHSTYEDKIESNNHNKLYLFENVNMTKFKYNQILKKIIPTIDEIVNKELENFKNCNYISDINEILNKYFITINDLSHENYEKIIKIVKPNYEKLNSTFNINKKYDFINYFYKNTEYLTKNKYYLSDDYLFDKEVVKYYGNYPYKKTSYDSITQRFNWLKSKSDYGNLYYKIVNLSNQDNKIQIKYLENKLSQIKNNIANINKINQVKDKPKKSSDCSIYKYEAKQITDLTKENKDEDTYYFYENELFVFIDNEFKKVINSNSNNSKNIHPQPENDDLLLLDNKELWVYKNKKWEFSKNHSNYNKLEYLCKFKNIKLENLDLDSLDCVYRKDYGCLSKTNLRNKLKLEEYNNFKNLFESLIQNIKDNIKINQIKSNIKENEQKFTFINSTNIKKQAKSNNKFKKLDKKLNQVEQANKSNKLFNLTPVDLLIKKIFNLSNDSIRENYFYQIIDKDCLLINNRLYSKKYKKEILCGHYYYLKKIYYADNENSATKFIDLLINTFSDNGENEENSHTCKICGEKLLNNDYDETEGFAESGQILMSREKWIKERSFDSSEQTLDDYLKDIKLDCNDDKFEELLITNGLNVENISIALDICNYITNNLYPKLGLSLSNGVLINNIIDIIQKIALIPSYNIYKIKEISKLKQAGISQGKIEKMQEKKYFEQKYKIFYEVKKQSIIVARVLISIQVNIPNLTVKNKQTSCEFKSFNEKDGIEFMACLLNEINKLFLINKEDMVTKYKNFIQDYYNDFKSYFYIQELFKEKKMYLSTLKKDKTIHIINTNKQKLIFNKEPSKIDKSFKNINALKSYSNFNDLYKKIQLRQIYVSYEIIDIINTIIGQSPLSDKTPSYLEKSCCLEDSSSYIDFFEYFQQFDPKTKIYDYLEESKQLSQLLKTKLFSYSYHRCKLISPNWKISILNYPVVYDGIHSSSNFTISVFKHYVDEGVYKGTPRNYIEEYSSSQNKNLKIIRYKDVKSGKYLDEIEKQEYSIDELNNLLKSVEQNNMRFINEISVNNKKLDELMTFEPEFIEKLKKESINGLGVQINLLVQNLTSILGKTKEYENRIIQIINNLFQFEVQSNQNVKSRLNELNSINNQQLDFYKKMYQKISKYLSIIKNSHEFDLEKKFELIDEPIKKSEMRTQIIEENNKLELLLNKDVAIYFKNLNMKYPISKINTLFGKRNIMNKDGNKIIKESNFNNNDAAILMSYFVFEQLNSFFDGYNSESIKIKIFDKSNKNKYVAQFINIIIEELEEYYQLFNICNKNNEFEHFEARLFNAYQVKILTSDQSVDIREFMQTVANSRGVQSETQYSTLEDEIKISDEKKDLLDLIKDKSSFEKLKQEYVENNDEELDLLTIKQIKERIDEEEKVIEEDDFISDGSQKSSEVLDSGSEYGALSDYDFETGEGFPDSEYD